MNGSSNFMTNFTNFNVDGINPNMPLDDSSNAGGGATDAGGVGLGGTGKMEVTLNKSIGQPFESLGVTLRALFPSTGTPGVVVVAVAPGSEGAKYVEVGDVLTSLMSIDATKLITDNEVRSVMVATLNVAAVTVKLVRSPDFITHHYMTTVTKADPKGFVVRACLIRDVDEGGLAHASGLRPGMCVLGLNGAQCHVDQDIASNFVDGLNTFIVTQRRDLIDGSLRTHNLLKKAGKDMGLELFATPSSCVVRGAYIVDVDDPVMFNDKLQCGQQILKLNNTSLRNLTMPDIMTVVKSCKALSQISITTQECSFFKQFTMSVLDKSINTGLTIRDGVIKIVLPSSLSYMSGALPGYVIQSVLCSKKGKVRVAKWDAKNSCYTVLMKDNDIVKLLQRVSKKTVRCIRSVSARATGSSGGGDGKKKSVKKKSVKKSNK